MPSMNAIDLLKQDHEKVRKLLKELSETTHRATKKREELLEKIRNEVLVHTQIEEEIFYPAFREEADEAEKLFFEAKEEHRAVGDLVLPDLEQTEVTSDAFLGRVKVFKDLLEHHVEEEEEEMFAKAKKAMSNDQLLELGEQMAARRQELRKQM